MGGQTDETHPNERAPEEAEGVVGSPECVRTRGGAMAKRGKQGLTTSRRSVHSHVAAGGAGCPAMATNKRASAPPHVRTVGVGAHRSVEAFLPQRNVRPICGRQP